MAENVLEKGTFEDEAERLKFKEDLEQRNAAITKIYAPNTNREEGVLNGLNIACDAAFGINSKNIVGQLQMIGESSVVYTVTNMIVIKDLVSRQYQFISKEGRLKSITCLKAY